MTRQAAGHDRARPDGWPRIVGSPNAVDWAIAIRRETIERFDDLLRGDVGELGEDNRAYLVELGGLVRTWMLAQNDASLWIANRSASVRDWFRLAARSDQTIRAFIEARSRSS